MRRRCRGFTLIEVVVAVVVLEAGVLAALATLLLASRTLGRAERLERAVAAAEGVVDSLAGLSAPGPGGVRAYAGGELRWRVDPEGRLDIAALDTRGDSLFTLGARVGSP